MCFKELDKKKWLIAALVAAVIAFVYSFVTCGWLFNWVYFLEPVNMWKNNFSLTWLATSFVFTLIFMLIWVFIYSIVQKAIPGEKWKKGLYFGLGIWAVGTLPGMFSTYMTMAVNTGVVIYWTIGGLIKYLILGAVIALLYKAK